MSQQETTLEAKLRQIPLEDALAALDAFLKDNDLEMSATRSGMKRTISNVSTYYNKSSANGVTRSSAPDDIPDAYLVNFGENEGFVVLGANENVADIVAVTENGNITEELEIVFVGDHLIIDGVTVEDEYEDTVEDDDLYEIPIETIDWYCAEDDDYYTASESVSDLVSEMIKNGINQPLNYEVVENEEEEQHIGSDVYPTPTYVIKEPLLKTSWGQREPYNNIA